MHGGQIYPITVQDLATIPEFYWNRDQKDIYTLLIGHTLPGSVFTTVLLIVNISGEGSGTTVVPYTPVVGNRSLPNRYQIYLSINATDPSQGLWPQPGRGAALSTVSLDLNPPDPAIAERNRAIYLNSACYSVIDFVM